MYMSHAQRGEKQDRRIGNVMDRIRRGEMENKVLTIVDYKLNFELIRLKETSLEFL